MWLEWIGPATLDVISKVKIVERMTPMKELGTCEYWLPSCNVISYIYSFWVGLEFRSIVLLDWLIPWRQKKKVTVFFFPDGTMCTILLL